MATYSNRWYGWRKDKLDKRDRMLRVNKFMELPTAVDLRPEMPPVYDQGELGSCTANAIGGAIEHLIVTAGRPDVRPSRLFIYYEERVLEETVNEDSGAEIRDGVKVVAALGAPDENEWPYDISRFTEKPPAGVYEAAHGHLVTQYSKIESAEITGTLPFLNAVRTVLAQGHTIMFGFSVWSSFETREVAESGIMPMPDITREDMMGGHAVLMVGYNDTTRRVIVRNSWAEDWGQKGYFEIPYAFIADPKQASDFWTLGQVQ